MNINIATWGRLMKRAVPPCNGSTAFSPQSIGGGDEGMPTRGRVSSDDQNIQKATLINEPVKKYEVF